MNTGRIAKCLLGVVFSTSFGILSFNTSTFFGAGWQHILINLALEPQVAESQDHFTIPVADLAKSEAFYGLIFRPLDKHEQVYRGRWFSCDFAFGQRSNSALKIHIIQVPRNQDNYKPSVHGIHLGISVPNLSKTIDVLRGLQIPITQSAHSAEHIYFNDADGHIWDVVGPGLQETHLLRIRLFKAFLKPLLVCFRKETKKHCAAFQQVRRMFGFHLLSSLHDGMPVRL